MKAGTETESRTITQFDREGYVRPRSLRQPEGLNGRRDGRGGGCEEAEEGDGEKEEEEWKMRRVSGTRVAKGGNNGASQRGKGRRDRDSRKRGRTKGRRKMR